MIVAVPPPVTKFKLTPCIVVPVFWAILSVPLAFKLTVSPIISPFKVKSASAISLSETKPATELLTVKVPVPTFEESIFIPSKSE